jgi:hypothetical protein
MAGGGKGGSQSTSVSIPAWLEEAAQRNLARADQLAQIGYTPYYGPDVAALTPMQVQAMQGTNQAAGAFGMGQVDPMAGMPQAQDFGGVMGYSSAPIYQGAIDALRTNAPGQFAALHAPFIDPVTGAAPAAPYGMPPINTGERRGPLGRGGLSDGNGNSGSSGGGGSTSGGGTGSFGLPNPSTGRITGTNFGGGIGGYTSIGDMFNGGGPGQSGNTFSGSPISSVANVVGVRPSGSGGSSGMGGGK